jgi:hypothetical protein
MDLELSGRRVAATSLRSRTREVIRPGVAAETARLFDDPNNRTTTTDYRKSEGRYFSALAAAVRCDDVLSAYVPVSLTQIAVVPPSTTNSMPLT